MKLANVNGRAALVLGDEIADIATASDGRFGPDPMAPLRRLGRVRRRSPPRVTAGTGPLVEADLGSPVPRPRQVFAIGLNYRSHAEESGMAVPDVPATFTKFPASLAGPFDDIEIVGDARRLGGRARRRHRPPRRPRRRGRRAGPTSPGSPSARTSATATSSSPPARQFSLGKSRRGYGPMGPWVVTLDEVADPDDLALGCSVDGETVQDARTSDLIFGVPAARRRAVRRAARCCPATSSSPARPPASASPASRPGSSSPARCSRSWIEGIGTIRNVCR